MAEPWATDKEQVLDSLTSDPDKGLSAAEVQKRLRQFGRNLLVKERRATFWGVFKEEVVEPMILFLLVVGVLYAVWGKAIDTVTIFTVVTLLVFAEVFTEYRAKKAIYALRRLSPPTAQVLREGLFQRIAASEIVPGDILVLDVGERIPADARVIDSVGIEADESALTGESTPVSKEDKILLPDTPLAEKTNMVFSGTTITRGRGRAVVIATAMDTELGKITGLVLEAKEPKTPLQLAMKQLAGLLVWIAVFFSVLIPLIGIFQGKPWKDMVLTGLSLSFATIPEELPIIITMVLGIGAYTLSRKNVLVRRLRAAETLGSVTAVLSDKTGTITENRVTLVSIATDARAELLEKNNLTPAARFLLEVGVMASRIKKGAGDVYVGEPLEVALIEAAAKAGMAPDNLQTQFHLLREFSFDNQRKLMSIVAERGDEVFVYAKGAPEAILQRSSRIVQGESPRTKTSQDDERFHKLAGEMAGEAMIVLGFAYKKIARSDRLTQDEAESDLVFVGLAGLADPPRPGVREALNTMTEAGIRTLVVSGDHPLTVRRVASEVGLDTAGGVVTGASFDRWDESEARDKLKRLSLFARVTPEQKLKLVRLLQASGEIVAVTGDGVNDAPALKSADIGIAMAQRGTEVAREAAAMVLTDDNFTSIATGVREGRKIFDNLKKGITYYLSVKIALVLSFLVPLSLSIPFPFAPIQIVLLELFMDLAASATLVAEPIEPGAMQQSPRRRGEKFIDRSMLANIAFGSISLAIAVLFNYLITWYSSADAVLAQTVAFATWLVGHVFLAITMRSHRQPVWRIGVLSNRVMLVWAAAVFVLLVVITNLPATQAALRVASLSSEMWFRAFAVPLLAIGWLELKKAASHESRK